MHYMKEKENQSSNTERIRMILTAIVYIVIIITIAASMETI